MSDQQAEPEKGPADAAVPRRASTLVLCQQLKIVAEGLRAYGHDARAALIEEAVDEVKAAGHWFSEANQEHNRAEKLEADLAAVRVERDTLRQQLDELRRQFEILAGIRE